MASEHKTSTFTSEDIDKLLHAESPYRWKPIIRDENRHENEVPENEPFKFCYYSFIAELVESYDEYVKKNLSKSVKIVQHLVEMLDKLKADNCSDPFFIQISDALYHVIFTWNAQLLLFSDPSADVTPILKKVVSSDEMDASNKAALHAIRSSVEAFYSYDGTCSAISHIKKALAIDPKNAFWHFLNGAYLYKLRNLNNMDEPPLLEEKKLLEEANRLENDNPLFMLYLADVYRENMVHAKKQEGTYSLYLPDAKSRSDLFKKIEEKGETSLKLYRKSYEMKPFCPLVSFRCAYGLMMLPAKYRDIKQAKKIIVDNIKKYPHSGYGNWVAAMYYKSYGEKANLAKEYLKKSIELNIFKAHINKIRQEYQEHLEKNSKYDAVAELKKLMKIFVESPKQGMILSQIVSYYLFENYDLRKACEYTTQYFTSQINGTCLQVHRSCFRKFEQPISLIDVLTDEIKYTLNDPKLKPEMRTFLNEFVHKINFQNLSILKGKPINLRKQLLSGHVSVRKGPVYQNRHQGQQGGQIKNSYTNRNVKPQFKSEEIRKPEMNCQRVEPKENLRDVKVSKQRDEFQKVKMTGDKDDLSSSSLPAVGNRKVEKKVEEKENSKPDKTEIVIDQRHKNTKKVVEKEIKKPEKSIKNKKTHTMTSDNELENFHKKWEELSLRNRKSSRLGTRNSSSVHKIKDTVGDQEDEYERIGRINEKKKRRDSSEDERSRRKLERKYRSRRRDRSSSSESYSSDSDDRKSGHRHRKSEKERRRHHSHSGGYDRRRRKRSSSRRGHRRDRGERDRKSRRRYSSSSSSTSSSVTHSSTDSSYSSSYTSSSSTERSSSSDYRSSRNRICKNKYGAGSYKTKQESSRHRRDKSEAKQSSRNR